MGGRGNPAPTVILWSTRPLYAEAGISDYWIFNLVDNCLESYSEPYQDLQGKCGYRKKVIFLPNESVNLPCFLDLFLDLSKVFPEMMHQR